MSGMAILFLVVFSPVFAYAFYNITFGEKTFGEKRSELKRQLQKQQTDYNRAYTCTECSISYRFYQLDTNERDGMIHVCPHCGERHAIRRANADVYYPFAPKLTLKETRQLIAREGKMREMDKKLKEAARIEKELAAYQALEEQKLTKMKKER